MNDLKVDWTKITRAEFQAYEDFRTSDTTKMFAGNVLGRDIILAIMEHYSDLDAKYHGV